ncbi:MAG: hypothetical protein PWP23_1839 [Candidatus Sumerlaeota bacterium]|nr:hypothetical protein [Candidatus Sumerlaeota bacterium]
MTASEYYEKALDYLEADQVDRAAAALRVAVELDPSHLEAHVELGHVLDAIGDLEGAREAFERAAELDPADPDVQMGAARVLFDLNKPLMALVRARRAAQLSPYSAEAHALVAGMLVETEQAEEALAVARNIRGLDSTSPEGPRLEGRALLELGRGEEAAGHLRQAVMLAPDDSVPAADLADCMAALGDVADAERQYRRSLDLNADAANVWFNLATLLHRQERHGEALEAFGQVVRLDPGDAQAWAWKGSCHRALGEYSAARECSRNAVEQDGKLLDGWLLWASCCAEEGKTEEALEATRKAAEAHPASPFPALYESEIHHRLGHSENALRAADKALKLDEAFAPAHRLRGEVLAGSKRWNEAIASYRRARELEPGDHETHQLLIAGLVRAHRFREAWRESRLLARESPADAAQLRRISARALLLGGAVAVAGGTLVYMLLHYLPW